MLTLLKCVQTPEQVATAGEARLASERQKDEQELEIIRQRELAEKRAKVKAGSARLEVKICKLTHRSTPPLDSFSCPTFVEIKVIKVWAFQRVEYLYLWSICSECYGNCSIFLHVPSFFWGLVAAGFGINQFTSGILYIFPVPRAGFFFSESLKKISSH